MAHQKPPATPKLDRRQCIRLRAAICGILRLCVLAVRSVVVAPRVCVFSTLLKSVTLVALRAGLADFYVFVTETAAFGARLVCAWIFKRY